MDPTTGTVRAVCLRVLMAAFVTGAAAEAVAGQPEPGAASRTLFRETFTREEGTPVTETRVISIANFRPPFVLSVQSGDAGINRVSSATVSVNGRAVLRPSDFNRGRSVSFDVRRIPIALTEPATLAVAIQGAPGSTLTLWIDGTPAEDPLTITLDTERGVASRFDVAKGGLLATEGADGTTFSLQVPPRATADAAPLTIQMTPIADVSGLPAPLRFVAGAEFGPSGLQFATPLTLTIPLPVGVDPDRLMAIAYSGAAGEYSFVPLIIDWIQGTLRVPIAHFSSILITEGWIDNCVQLGKPQSQEDRYVQAVACVVNHPTLSDEDRRRLLVEVFSEWRLVVVLPAIDLAVVLGTLTSAENAALMYQRWHEQQALTRVDDLDPLPALDAVARDMLSGHLAETMRSLDAMCRVSLDRCAQEGWMQSFLNWAHLAEVNAFPLPIATNEFCDGLQNTIADAVSLFFPEQPLVKHRLVRLEAFATARGSHQRIDSPLTWSTSDPSVLWLDGPAGTDPALPGVVVQWIRPLKEGTAVITVTAGCSVSTSRSLTVVAPSGPVASVVMYHGGVILANHANVILTEQETVVLSAIAKNEDGDILEGASIVWGSDLTSVAYIGDIVVAPDQAGILRSVAPVHGAGAGDATITASSEGRSATVFVHVTRATPPDTDPTDWTLKGRLPSYRSNWSHVFNSMTESTELTGEGRSIVMRERWSGRLDGSSTFRDGLVQSIGMTGSVAHEFEETRILSCAQFGTSGGTTVTIRRFTYSPSPSSAAAMAQRYERDFFSLSSVWEGPQGQRTVRYAPPRLSHYRWVSSVQQLRYSCQPDGTLGSSRDSGVSSIDGETTSVLYWPVPMDRFVALPFDALRSSGRDDLMFSGDPAVATLTVELELLDDPAIIVSAEVSPPQVEIPVGGTANVYLFLTDSEGWKYAFGQTVWSSTDPGIAIVEGPLPGNLRGITTGVTTITGDYHGNRATGTVYVGRRFAAIDVIPSPVTLRVGGYVRLEAIFRDNFGGTYPPKPVTWRSSNPVVARVNAFGEVFGESFGEAEITAESDGLESAPVTVIVDSRAVSLRIDPALPRIALSDAAFLWAWLTDRDGVTFTDPGTIWSSSHPEVATVQSTGEAGIDRALLTPRGEGTTTITARFESVEATMVVTVYRDVFRVDITPASGVIHVGKNLQLSAVVTDSAGVPFADKPVSWRSTDSSVASVDADGNVAAVAIGFAGIIATAEGVNSPTTWIEVVADTSATVSTISGHVFYSSTPLAGFTVSLHAGSSFDAPIETVQSGADGSYVFGLVPVGQYLVRVDGGGEFVPWTAFGVNASTAETVLNMYLPKILTLVSPAHLARLDISAGAPALTWSPNAEADTGGRYVIQINASGTSPAFEIGENATNSYTIQQALQPGVDYTWQVDAFDANHRWVGSTTFAFRFTAREVAPQRLAAWGDADTGQIGDGFYSYRLAPVPVRGLNEGTAISAGDWHNLVATAAGTVWAWGLNDHGQLGFPMTPDTPAQEVFDDRTSLPGQVLDPGDVTGVLTRVTAVAAGLQFSVALKSDGTVWTWGSNDGKQLGNNCAEQVCASRTSPGAVSGLEDVVVRAVAAGERHALALAEDGTVWAWGQNAFGELGDGCEGLACVNRGRAEQIADLTGVVAIASGAVHAIALKSDGTVWAWGGTNAGQLGRGCLPDDCFWRSSTPIQVQLLDSVVAIAAGGNHNLALRTDGTLWTWGANEFGQLGIGAVGVPSVGLGTPVLVTDDGGTPFSGVSSIAAGRQHSLVIKTDGSAWAWGRNGSGQLGDGTWVNRSHPVWVRDFAGGVLLDGGAQHSLAALTSAVPNAASNQGTVGPQGGAVATVLAPPLDNLAATVEIPAGALASDAIISITELAAGDASLPDPPIHSLSRVFQIAPQALTFSAPVDLIFHYDDAELAGRDEGSLIVNLLAGGEYVVVNDCSGPGVYPCTARRDRVNNTITVRTDHFSTFLLSGAR
jgi:alpha-tubulin suppressor-like RCC1 family protein